MSELVVSVQMLAALTADRKIIHRETIFNSELEVRCHAARFPLPSPISLRLRSKDLFSIDKYIRCWSGKIKSIAIVITEIRKFGKVERLKG